MTKVLVLGASGMLGRALVRELRSEILEVITAGRGFGDDLYFDAQKSSVSDLLKTLDEGDYVINAIGIIKHRIDEMNPAHVEQAFKINAEFPIELSNAGCDRHLKIIQIATDCVFSGSTGGYNECSPHDATDVYGTSKSKGEVDSPSMMHIRCSIVGPERGRNLSLFEWVRSRPAGSTIPGYIDHYWNGVTTHSFAKVVAGVIKNDLFKPGVHHLVPSDVTTKANLVKMLAVRAGRSDLTVQDTETEEPMNRTLSTLDNDFNALLWTSAGYKDVPSIPELIQEMPIN